MKRTTPPPDGGLGDLTSVVELKSIQRIIRCFAGRAS